MTDVRHGSDQTSRDGADLLEAQVIAPLKRARLEPDDLQVARFCAALDTALEGAAAAKARAQGPAARRARWVRRGAIGGALAAVAAVALIVVPSLKRASPPKAVTMRAERTPRPIPIAYESERDWRVGDVVTGRPLVAPAGARLRGSIGDRAFFTLVGPGEVAAFDVAGGTDLELTSGRLIVDYNAHGSGKKLRVRSPGAVTTVVGTVFAVEALGRTSRVAVARGIVSVEGAGARVQQVQSGRSWRADAPETEPIPSDLAAELGAQADSSCAGASPGEARDEPREAPPTTQTPPTEAAARVRRAPTRPSAGKRDAETAYAAAEELMRAGSTTAARRALLAFVTAHPADPRAELALLDLARLALAAGHPIEARGYVARLLASTKDEALIDLARQVERRIDAAAPAAEPAR